MRKSLEMKKQYVRVKERKNNNKIKSKFKIKLCLKINLLLPGWCGSAAECRSMSQKVTVLFPVRAHT